MGTGRVIWQSQNHGPVPMIHVPMIRLQPNKETEAALKCTLLFFLLKIDQRICPLDLPLDLHPVCICVGYRGEAPTGVELTLENQR